MAISAIGRAAIEFAAQGFPVFPCNPTNKQPLLAARKDANGKPIRGTGGVSQATTAEQQIRAWWKRWPNAMIGLATGFDRVFVLDFDPRTDKETGEVFELAGLKAALEAQMGCALPESRTGITQSDGVHVWLRWPDDGGAEIRNRGNLPDHVDVRGKGGYIIAPPSVMENGNRYRWMKGKGAEFAIADAPAQLVEILRSKKRAPAAESERPAARPNKAYTKPDAGTVEAAVAKYGDAALMEELRLVRTAGSGKRNAQLNASAFAIATLVAAGALEESFSRSMLEAAARDNPGNDDDGQLRATIDSGWTAGKDNPRDLGEIADNIAARQRRAANPRARSAHPPSAPAPSHDPDGKPPSQKGGGRQSIGSEGGWGADVTRECAFMALTDQGNLERFVKRFGGDFRHVEAWGWLAWDGCRWNRERANSLIGRAIRMTMRAIQDEGDFIRASGVVIEGFLPPSKLAALRAHIGDARIFHEIEGDFYDIHESIVEPEIAAGALDRLIEIKSTGRVVMLSDKIRAWGRTSEGAGHISCLNSASMLQAELVALSDEFDVDPLKLNVLNGTLVFERPAGGRATVTLRQHSRSDMITKIANAAYHPDAACEAFDAYIARVQPDADMRHFLNCWSGYSALGDVSAQVFALFYGQGANGKSVWVDVHAHILGDYARVCGIETFIDQGRYRKGSDATPDLAALAGRRMVRASEPEEGTKFSDGLIKALTGTEPVPVRELNKPPFEMNVTFKCTVSANVKPKIGTDHGIQRRVRLVPWDVIIPDEEQDRLLLTKLKAEADGILAQMVQGAIAYLGNGLPMPVAIEAATREYREENDLLGRFIGDCIAEAKGSEVGATALHNLFVTWQNFVGEVGQSGKPWSMKYLTGQMKKKGYVQIKSSVMKWRDIKLTRDQIDFDGEHDLSPYSPEDDDDVPL